MNDNLKYYGSAESDSFTYLEFGSIDTKISFKRIWSMKLHQEAYDHFMLGRYFRDLLLYRDILNENSSTLKCFLDKVKQTAHSDIYNILLKYAAIRVAHDFNWGNQSLRLFEPGSTLFGLIDEMLALDFCLTNKKFSKYISDGHYYGLEISELLNCAAIFSHQDHNLYLEKDSKNFNKFSRSYDILYGFAITWQYLLKTAEDLNSYCVNSKISILSKITINKFTNEGVKLGTGKFGHNISLKQYLECKSEAEKKVFIKESQFKELINSHEKTFTIDLISATPTVFDKFIYHLNTAIDSVNRTESSFSLSKDSWILLDANSLK